MTNKLVPLTVLSLVVVTSLFFVTYESSDNKTMRAIGQDSYWKRKVTKWNSKDSKEDSLFTIFWPPATKVEDTVYNEKIHSGWRDNRINDYGDEVASVLGRPPAFTCTDMEFNYRSKYNGQKFDTIIRGTDNKLLFNFGQGRNSIQLDNMNKCDNPTQAEGTQPCGTQAWLGTIPSPISDNVKWWVLCRKTERFSGVDQEDSRVEKGFARGSDNPSDEWNRYFWDDQNYEVSLLGFIGWNELTGEAAFFDGNQGGFDAPKGPIGLGGIPASKNFKVLTRADKELLPPGGTNYNDENRIPGLVDTTDLFSNPTKILGHWDFPERGFNNLNFGNKPPATAPCIFCHTNNDPFVYTKYLDDPQFSIHESASEPMPYRPVGKPFIDRVMDTDIGVANVFDRANSNATIDARNSLTESRYLKPQNNSSCFGCHTLPYVGTSMWTFVADSLAFKGRLKDSGNEADEFLLSKSNSITDYGKQHHYNWMPKGGEQQDPAQEVAVLKNCLDKLVAPRNEKELAKCLGDKIFTQCVKPESTANVFVGGEDVTRAHDPYGPTGLAGRDGPNPEPEFEYDRRITVTWKYLNWFGQVKTRDDVRFDLTITEVVEPGSQVNEDGLVADPEIVPEVIRDISYKTHYRYNDPEPVEGEGDKRDYEVLFPAQCGKKYRLDLVSKRFCFDLSNVLNADNIHTTYVQTAACPVPEECGDAGGPGSDLQDECVSL